MPGDMMEDVLVITSKQLSTTTSGKYFIKAFVSDASQQVTARMWNATRELFSALPESGFIRVRGRMENYQNNLQFIIEQAWPAKPGSFDIADLMPSTQKNVDEMFAQVTRLLGSLKNPHLKALANAYLADTKMMADFRKAPAAMSFHHAYIGGLLEHTLNAMEVADAIVKFYPGLNRDVLVLGIFLHDIAKTWELSFDCAFGYTDGGQLIGHIVKSAMWVEEKAAEAEKATGQAIPREIINVLEHIILSHHGTPEFGAARTPSTPEAIAVHYIEDLDAKMMMSLSVTRGEPTPGAEGNWTEYQRAFNGRLYRPDVAGDQLGEAGGEPAGAGGKDFGSFGVDSPAAAPITPNAPSVRATESANPAANAKLPPGGKIAITNPLFGNDNSRKGK